jgi:hypothetical protein
MAVEALSQLQVAFANLRIALRTKQADPFYMPVK